MYDFEICADQAELRDTIRGINQLRYTLISVSQDGSGVYTVFFQVPV